MTLFADPLISIHPPSDIYFLLLFYKIIIPPLCIIFHFVSLSNLSSFHGFAMLLSSHRSQDALKKLSVNYTLPRETHMIIFIIRGNLQVPVQESVDYWVHLEVLISWCFTPCRNSTWNYGFVMQIFFDRFIYSILFSMW